MKPPGGRNCKTTLRKSCIPATAMDRKIITLDFHIPSISSQILSGIIPNMVAL